METSVFRGFYNAVSDETKNLLIIGVAAVVLVGLAWLFTVLIPTAQVAEAAGPPPLSQDGGFQGGGGTFSGHGATGEY